MLQKLIYSIFVFLSSKISKFYVYLFILELFLDEHAMVLRYSHTSFMVFSETYYLELCSAINTY